MKERPHSRYTRDKAWVALGAQYIEMGYAIIEWSLTNGSFALINCSTPDAALKKMLELKIEANSEACKRHFASRQSPDKAPAIIAGYREAVVLGRSSDYLAYRLANHPEFKLVVACIHDSFLHLPVWELETNHLYKARETKIPLDSDEFRKKRGTQFGHNLFVAAIHYGNKVALDILEGKNFPARSRRRIRYEVAELQKINYVGRPLEFLTQSESEEWGKRVRQGLAKRKNG